MKNVLLQEQDFLKHIFFKLNTYILIEDYPNLTHWGPVMPYGDTDLGQHWLK